MPANRTISYFPDFLPDYDLGTVATYLCNPGFSLEGNGTTTCVTLGIVSEWDRNKESLICTTDQPNNVGLVVGTCVGAVIVVLLMILIVFTLFTIIQVRRKVGNDSGEHIYEDPDENNNNQPSLLTRNICVNESYNRVFEMTENEAYISRQVPYVNESEIQRLSSNYIEMGPVVNESFTRSLSSEDNPESGDQECSSEDRRDEENPNDMTNGISDNVNIPGDEQDTQNEYYNRVSPSFHEW